MGDRICENQKENNIDMSNVINRLFEGDCLEYMKEIPDGSVDMILCDLPYGMTQNKWDSYIPLDKLWEQYNRIIKTNGAIVLTSNGVFTAKLILSQPNIYKYKWVWEKSKPTNFLNAKKQPLRKHEDVCVFYKKQPVYHPQMTKGEPYVKEKERISNVEIMEILNLSMLQVMVKDIQQILFMLRQQSLRGQFYILPRNR